MQKQLGRSLWEVLFDMHKHLEKQFPSPAWALAEDKSSSPGKNTNRAGSSQLGILLQQRGSEKSTYCKLPFARNLWLQTHTSPPREIGSLGDVNQEKAMTQARASWGDDAKRILPTRNTTHPSVLPSLSKDGPLKKNLNQRDTLKGEAPTALRQGGREMRKYSVRGKDT